VSGPYLGIDSATPYLSLALWWPEAQRCIRVSQRVDRGLSRLIAPQVAALLASQSLHPPSLRGVAVGIGPGSTTGVRIGHAFALGLARACDLPIVTDDTLAALAAAAWPEGGGGWVGIEGRRGLLWAEEGERRGDGVWVVRTPRHERPRAELPSDAVVDLPPDAGQHLMRAWPTASLAG
jgi:tRNA threonylcarbamoyladenosine biosynthesis protein TsaB